MKTPAALLFALPALLGGCIPYPRMSEISPHVTGRVIDARTRAPVPGARVVVAEPPPGVSYLIGVDPKERTRARPSTAVTTNAAGVFDLPAHEELLLWETATICSTSGPQWHVTSDYIRVSHPGYAQQTLEAAYSAVRDRNPDREIQLKDIRLVPLPAGEKTGPRRADGMLSSLRRR